MTAPALFSVFNMLALAGWIILAAGVVLKRPWLRDTVCGVYIPVALSAAYAILMVLFFAGAPGGFDTLENVQLLFTSPWVALGGWVHYLAFDLFMGSRIARGMAELDLPRWPLVILLPATFLFGPIGFLAFEILKAAILRTRAAP
ncbi:MAG: abscisic acid-deficient protein Aba4 family protein [Aestuariivirga sp.]